MYIDKSTEFKIRNKLTGEIKTAYQCHKPWIIVDEKGNEIMSDWEVYEGASIFKSITAVSSLFLITGFIYWVCFSESFYWRILSVCDACR